MISVRVCLDNDERVADILMEYVPRIGEYLYFAKGSVAPIKRKHTTSKFEVRDVVHMVGQGAEDHSVVVFVRPFFDGT